MFDVPALQIKQTSSQLEYEISDGNGAGLGRAVQVAGPKPRKGLLGMFGSGVGDARVVVQVHGANGAPLFFVDRHGGSPVAIMAPDGSLIGRFAEDRVAAAQQMAGGGVLRMALGGGGVAMCHVLLDAADRPLCRLNWRIRRDPHHHEHHGPHHQVVGCDYTDMNGVSIANLDVREAFHKDEYGLQFIYQLPEPLRTLTIASPLAYDLTRS